MNLKDYQKKPQKFASGHRSCAGCSFPITVRNILASTDKDIVVSNATGCLEVTSTIYPFSSWKVPYIHSAFENAASTISGIEAAYQILKRKKKIKKDIKFIAFGGDGGTYDIGLQALSGALERGHDFLYVLYDTEAYSNTGYQRSSATPYGASTTTDPYGKVRHGKSEFRKDIMKIVAAHNIPYLAQASPSNFEDLTRKAEKALSMRGPCFINVISPCVPGWKIDMGSGIKVARLAVETRFWPLYEIEDGKYTLNYKPHNYVPIEEFLKLQGRFKHVLKPENAYLLQEIQSHIDSEWEKLLRLCGEISD